MDGYTKIHPLPFPDSFLPSAPEWEGITPVLPQLEWCGHNHSSAGLIVKVDNFTGVLWTALEGQVLGRELVATLCYINWQNKREKKENQAKITLLIHVLWAFFWLSSDVTYFSWKLIPRHLSLLEAEFGGFFVSNLKIWTHLQTVA